MLLHSFVFFRKSGHTWNYIFIYIYTHIFIFTYTFATVFFDVFVLLYNLSKNIQITTQSHITNRKVFKQIPNFPKTYYSTCNWTKWCHPFAMLEEILADTRKTEDSAIACARGNMLIYKYWNAYTKYMKNITTYTKRWYT